MSGKRGRSPFGSDRMLCMYFLQQWYGLADEAVDEAVYNSQALRNFMSIDLSYVPTPVMLARKSKKKLRGR